MEGTEVLLHSDTLFSAFLNSYLLLYGEEKLDLLIEQFLNGSPPFLFSSAFPFFENEYFFPVPRNFFPREKDLKKARFIGKKEFEDWLGGSEELMQKENPESLAIIPPVSRKKAQPYEIQSVPHVSLDYFRYSSQLFHSSNLFFREGGGLFFLIDLREPDFQEKVLGVLRFVGDEGIGGDRSSGCGGFKAEFIADFSLNLPQNPDAVCLLSLCFPGENDQQVLWNGYYDLIERKGYVFSPFQRTLRKRSVRMVLEGSVFKGNALRGTFLEVTPRGVKASHPVFRNGLAFTVPCVWREYET
ncbi:MAG: type III-A CRISPR-associated RAMP protein Csm4 [Caldiserica bacterium]|jgi:CRISPR-associated protein Csm4|nr:type III-A CRISPR-associated RAMP protein Csm4 [Caldisericota bacterium]MDH7562834.1 type III-A CRISPR-associated RAMP protein Csm4 [Caldisericota bacterium]